VEVRGRIMFMASSNAPVSASKETQYAQLCEQFPQVSNPLFYNINHTFYVTGETHQDINAKKYNVQPLKNGCLRGVN
jgi:hypothetical protein